MLFDTKLNDLTIKNGKIVSITANGNEYKCDSLILATGHSARDIYEMFNRKGWEIQASAGSFPTGAFTN